jgi:nucleotide-binding universal stress UspA family protein
MEPILVATDFSPASRRAVDLAVHAARAVGRPLVLVHAMDTGRSADRGGPRAISAAEKTLRERVRARVEAAEAELRREADRVEGVAVRTAVLDGTPWRAIVVHASEVGAAMIVVGAHGTSGPAQILRDAALGWLLGVTADRVVRTAPCPVLVATGEGPLPSFGGATWAVGADLDALSGHAIETAVRLARAARSRLEVVHVVPPTSMLEGALDDLRGHESELESLAAEAALRAGETKRPRTSVRTGDPVARLLDAAFDAGAALVVVGSHCRRGIQHTLLGSVAERVLRSSSLPVLVVPAPGR